MVMLDRLDSACAVGDGIASTVLIRVDDEKA